MNAHCVIAGIVIQMIDDRMSPATAKTILQGSADPLNSAFHLTYNMVGLIEIMFVHKKCVKGHNLKGHTLVDGNLTNPLPQREPISDPALN